MAISAHPDSKLDAGHGLLRSGSVARVAGPVERRGREPMQENKNVKLDELKAQIASAEYDVDVDAVASAFVTRMFAIRGAMCRADLRSLLGDAANEIRLPA